ncbi:MAG: hypothetical protein QM296_09465 [Bacillota bacterium]|nr:hypothetical protein [Bacillota bacterium]
MQTKQGRLPIRWITATVVLVVLLAIILYVVTVNRPSISPPPWLPIRSVMLLNLEQQISETETRYVSVGASQGEKIWKRLLSLQEVSAAELSEVPETYRIRVVIWGEKENRTWTKADLYFDASGFVALEADGSFHRYTLPDSEGIIAELVSQYDAWQGEGIPELIVIPGRSTQPTG